MTGTDIFPFLLAGHVTTEQMFALLRDESISLNTELLTVGSQVSVVSPAGSKVPDCHWFTGTPNPCMSFFKPFIFYKDADIGQNTKSPDNGDRKSQDVDWRHNLYKAHETGMRKMESGSDEGVTLVTLLQSLESTSVKDIDDFLQTCDGDNLSDVEGLFKDVTESEIKFYKWY